ncbi:retrovirus-related pol polyprotein from transposon TNT 1-94 [Tanacetum coccineum]
MSRTMLNEQSLPQKFWCNAVDTSTYILNRILIRAILGKTPYELLRESLNVIFDETPPPSKTSSLVYDDLDEEEAIKVTEKKNLENDIEDETLEINDVVNIKESRNHPLENLFQMDVKSAFLNGFINEEVYVAQPSEFIDFEKLDHVYKLKKALYGFKQAPKACNYGVLGERRYGVSVPALTKDHEGNKIQYAVNTDDPNITMEEYIRLEEEKARRHGKVYNWEIATYGRLWDDNDVHNLRSVETEFPAIVFDDTFTSQAALSYEPMVSPLNDNEIDFRLAFDESDDEDYTPTVSYFDDLDYLKDFENELPAIVYNDALTSKSYFLTEPTMCPQHVDEFNLKYEISWSECDKEEQNILYFNDLFPFNIIYPDSLKSDEDNDDMALPPRDQRHQYLRFGGLGYTDADITNFEERLDADGAQGCSDILEDMAELLLNKCMEKVQIESNLSITNTNNDMNIEHIKEFLTELLSNTYHVIHHEDVVDHIAMVLKMLDLINIPGVDSHRLRMKVFPLSLTDDARQWWINEGEGKITTWEELVEKFFCKFYPESYDGEEEMLDEGNNWGIDPLEFLSRVNSSFENHRKVDGRTKKDLAERKEIDEVGEAPSGGVTDWYQSQSYREPDYGSFSYCYFSVLPDESGITALSVIVYAISPVLCTVSSEAPDSSMDNHARTPYVLPLLVGGAGTLEKTLLKRQHKVGEFIVRNEETLFLDTRSIFSPFVVRTAATAAVTCHGSLDLAQVGIEYDRTIQGCIRRLRSTAPSGALIHDFYLTQRESNFSYGVPQPPQFEDSCAVRDDLRKTYEKCNDISQRSRTLICTLLKESSEKDRKLCLSMYRKAAKLEKQMDSKLAWFQEKYSCRTHGGAALLSSQAVLPPLTIQRVTSTLVMDENSMGNIEEIKP